MSFVVSKEIPKQKEDEPIEQKLKRIINASPCMLFMKVCNIFTNKYISRSGTIRYSALGNNTIKHLKYSTLQGNPDVPKCGFSRQTIEILNGLDAEFGTFDILADETVRQELKTYSNWPTYPQVCKDDG